MIDYAAFDIASLLPESDSLVLPNLIKPQSLKTLIQAFPQQGFEPYEKHIDKAHPNRDVSYYLYCYHAGNLDRIKQDKSLADCWVQLYNEMASEKYKQALSKWLNVDLQACQLKIEFARYKKGCFLAKHYDREKAKRLTQLIYMNEVWQPEWGGQFNVLDYKNTGKVLLSIPPVFTYSVVVLCTNKAWHEVAEVLGPEDRKVVALEYYVE